MKAKIYSREVKILIALSLVLLIFFGGIWYKQKLHNLNGNNYQISMYSPQVSPVLSDHEQEPDNTFDEAYPLQSGVLTKANFSTNGDHDFYRFYVSKPSNLTITLKDLPKQYELNVYNPENQVIGKSTRQGFKSTISTIEVDKPGKYYIEMVPEYTDNNSVPYSIEVTSTPL